MELENPPKNGPVPPLANEVAKQEIAAVSELPYSLVGTIVRTDSTQSIATVAIKPNESKNYLPQSEIEQVAVVERIEREVLKFRNKKNGRLEYIRVGPYDPKKAVSLDVINDQATSEKEFHVQRKNLDEALSNLPEILKDAAVIPVMNDAGQVAGFKITFLKKGSVFASLGLQEGDVLKTVNGATLDSPATAVELFTQFQNSSMINLAIERGQRRIGLTYLIR